MKPVSVSPTPVFTLSRVLILRTANAASAPMQQLSCCSRDYHGDVLN